VKLWLFWNDVAAKTWSSQRFGETCFLSVQGRSVLHDAAVRGGAPCSISCHFLSHFDAEDGGSILVTITVNILVNILVTIWPKQSPHFCLVFRMSGVHFSARTPDTVAGFRNFCQFSSHLTSLPFRYFLYPTPHSLSYHCRYVTEASAVFCVYCSCLNRFSLFRQNACTDSTTLTLCLSYLQAS
jgi:hypothetical protein